MSAFVYYSDELLQPISAELPCGKDLRYEAVFSEILEARRSEDDLNQGDWEPEGGRKVAEWARVAQLCLDALQTRTKDLRIASYLTEAALRLDGFEGLSSCFKLNTAYLRRFWDKGLFPDTEDGDLDHRAGSLTWLNNRVSSVIALVPITARENAANYSLAYYRRAQVIGSDASISSDARISEERRTGIQNLLDRGWVTLTGFENALNSSKTEALEPLYRAFEESHRELADLENTVDELFGDVAPTFSETKEAFTEIRNILKPVLKKREEKKAPAAAAGAEPEGNNVAGQASGVQTFLFASISGVESTTAWTEAEALVRQGNVDQGVSRMAALAAAETSGRARFLRRLMLSDVCLAAGRERLARTLLEDLNREIQEYKLERWESSGLVGAVWSRLYKIYKKADSSSDQDTAGQLYNQLCRLDPWQAFVSCDD